MIDSAAPGRVLVVDDDPAVLQTVEGLLSLDFSVRSARDVTQAEAALKVMPFDVVITDFEMPGRSGLELVRIVQDTYPGTMVIILTGHPEIAEVQHSEDSQAAVRVIAKPYDPARLVQWIVRTVKLARLRQATQRLQQRAPRCAAVLKVELPGTPGATHLLTNLGVGGCFVRTAQKLAVGDRVELTLSFPKLLDPLPLGGEVRWIAEAGDGAPGVGVAFRNPSRRAVDTLKRLVEQWLRDRTAGQSTLRVVFLEPKPTLRQAYGSSLSRALKPEPTVVWVSDAHALALRVAEAHTDLAIIDTEPSSGDVASLLTQLRATPGGEQLPVVLLSLQPLAPLKDKLVMNVTKPVAIDGLLRTVRTLMSARLEAAGLNPTG